MKIIVALLAVVFIVVTGYVIWAQYKEISEVYRAVELLEIERDNLISDANYLRSKADSFATVSDSLEARLRVEQAEADAEARVLESKVDSLSEEMLNMIPDSILRGQIQVALVPIRRSYEDQINRLTQISISKDALLLQKDFEISTLRLELSDKDRIIQITEQQRDEFEEALRPVGFFGKFKKNAGVIAGSTAVLTLVGIMLAGG
jgi:hypothetical protein